MAATRVDVIGFITLTGWLLVVCRSDWRQRRVPDRMVLTGSVLGLIFIIASSVATDASIGEVIFRSLLGFGTGLLIGVAMATPGLILFGRPSVGGGDIKLLAALGIWFGPLSIPIILLLSLPPIVLYFAFTRLRRNSGDPVTDGPYAIALGLAASSWYLLGGEGILINFLRRVFSG